MRSNSSSIKYLHPKTEAQLLQLARNQQYPEGLSIIEQQIKKNGPSEEILLQKAFFLYHYAAALLYGDAHDSRKSYLIQKNFEQAIVICRQIIKSHYSAISNENFIKARLYLAQIYAMLGQKKRAQQFAQQTFTYQPSALVAERAADVYLRTGNMRGAIDLYKKAVSKAKDPAQKLFAQIGLAVTYKQMRKTSAANKQASRAAKLITQVDEDGNIKLLRQSLYEHFPNLQK